jgi:hypothetical protein
VASLIPSTQACLAVAVALFAQDGETPDNVTLQCVQRLVASESMANGSVASVQNATSVAVAKVVQMQLVVVSARSSVSLVFAKSLIHVMERLSPGALSFLPLVLVSLERDDGVSVEADRLKLVVNQSVQTIDSLETFVEGSKENFAQYNVKTLSFRLSMRRLSRRLIAPHVLDLLQLCTLNIFVFCGLFRDAARYCDQLQGTTLWWN